MSDPTTAILAELDRLFPDASGPGERALLGAQTVDAPQAVLARAPRAVRALILGMGLGGDYVHCPPTGEPWTYLMGLEDFELANGPTGLIGHCVARGLLPPGVLEIGGHLLVDPEGAMPAGIRGAVYRVPPGAVIDVRTLPVASSILELLRVSAPDAPLGPGWIPDDEDTVPAPF